MRRGAALRVGREGEGEEGVRRRDQVSGGGRHCTGSYAVESGAAGR